MSYATACWEEIEPARLQWGELGRMPRYITHPTKPHDKGWTNRIFAGWVGWRGHRAAWVIAWARWSRRYWSNWVSESARPAGILAGMIWDRELRELMAGWPSQFSPE